MVSEIFDKEVKLLIKLIENMSSAEAGVGASFHFDSSLHGRENDLMDEAMDAVARDNPRALRSLKSTAPGQIYIGQLI